jgi:hypothetical protein
LKEEGGGWIEEEKHLEVHINHYFESLVPREVTDPDEEVVNKVTPCVTEDMNASLYAPYSREEVKKALFNIGDLKAPCPDVMNAISSGAVPEGWNNTNIMLIPKVDNLESISQYRPISLCNVLYKVISKVLAARLKAILPEIISPTQSAFVPGRMITDNVLVAFECYHAIKRKRGGKYGNCAIKLDMLKAYDRVEWSFLQKILTRFGFAQVWIDLIMSRVGSVKYQVRFNGKRTEQFSPTRGL